MKRLSDLDRDDLCERAVEIASELNSLPVYGYHVLNGGRVFKITITEVSGSEAIEVKERRRKLLERWSKRWRSA